MHPPHPPFNEIPHRRVRDDPFFIQIAHPRRKERRGNHEEGNVVSGELYSTFFVPECGLPPCRDQPWRSTPDCGEEKIFRNCPKRFNGFGCRTRLQFPAPSDVARLDRQRIKPPIFVSDRLLPRPPSNSQREILDLIARHKLPEVPRLCFTWRERGRMPAPVDLK